MPPARLRNLRPKRGSTQTYVKHRNIYIKVTLLVVILFGVYQIISLVSKFEIRLVERSPDDESTILIEYEYIDHSQEEKSKHKPNGHDEDYESLDDVELAQYNYRYRYNIGQDRLVLKPKYRNVTRICSLRERLDHMKKYCDREKKLDDTFEHKDLIVDEKHNVLYCSVSRVASTSWKTVLAEASGKLPANITWPPVHNRIFLKSLGLRFLSDYPKPEADRITREYYKVIVVRHPFDRLVSIWRDKLVVRNSQSRWTLGAAILTEYRDANHYEPSLQWNDTARFHEFAQYLADKDVDDGEWSPLADVCAVCTYRWDAVLRVETSHNDSVHLLKRLADRRLGRLPFLHSHQGRLEWIHRLEKALPEMKNLSPQAFNYLRQKYEADFELFGYQWIVEQNRTRCAIPTASGECC